MTAEIAILNKNAVALAADSAVTLRDPSTSKIYNTANKLFMLSKFEPVGIMIYGSAEFMGVPLETIIKMYRSQLGSRNFPKLTNYAQNFLDFLGSNVLLFPHDKQTSSFVSIISRLYWTIRYEIDEQIKADIAKAPITDEDVKRTIDGKVGEYFENWSAVKRLSSCDEDFENDLAVIYGDSITKAIDNVFEKLPLQDCIDKLRKLSAFRITRDHWPDSCGLVFAGFGDLDVLPCVKSFVIEAVIHNKVRVNQNHSLSNDMNETPSASIMPFGQAEIVYRFIQGIDPEYKKEVRKYLRALLTKEYPDKLMGKFQNNLSEEDSRNALAELIKLGRAITEEFDQQWETLESNKYVGPVIDIVADLPKEDLAAMAESLVNLTSFKRRISREAETVGGPIDVAVISKGDGFVWIKRKHYFKKELNPNFFANYYRVRSGEGE
jgi:hypothetical protein